MKQKSFRLILLLGSYDPSTKKIMDTLKREILRALNGTNIHVYLLDEISIYANPEFFVIAEKWQANHLSIFIFDHSGFPIENLELKITGDIDTLVKRAIDEKYAKNVDKVPILEKFKILARQAISIIVIRDKEETRGGEIAELTYLILNKFSNKVCIFKKENITLSSMLMEFLDYMNVPIRTYRDTEDLIRSVIRYLNYRIREVE